MRWLYHIKLGPGSPLPARYAPASLASEGFLHASFQGERRSALQRVEAAILPT
jgi:hypothetical protein